MKKNKAIPQGYMTVGEVAKKMNVSVRTLQYYDKEGLFTPSAESEGGRRLYTDKDMIQLHQILSLKHLGFSLGDIKNRLISLDTPDEVARVLSEQAAVVRDKIECLSQSLKELEALKEEVLQMQSVNFKKYADIIVNLQMNNEFYFLIKYFDDDIEKIRHADEEEISSIEGIGPVIAGSLADYFKNAENNRKLDHLLSHLHLVHEETSAEQVFAVKTFVITGSVEHFSNRSEAKEFIEARGGKVTGSVTKKTDYLINNDKTSASSKNKKAQELGIPILSEEDFLELAGV